jgi:hypothetical protein
MTVVKFQRVIEHVPDGWRAGELQQVLAVSAKAISSGEASGWEVGTTECGDPQAFLIGPAPDHHCILSISRLGRLYVIEDGVGHVLCEHHNPMRLAEHAATALRRSKAALFAHIGVAWCTLREAFHEKMELMMQEPLEFLTHIAPQVSALA